MDFESGTWVWLNDETDFVQPAQVTVGFDRGGPGAIKTNDGTEIDLTPEQTKVIEEMDESFEELDAVSETLQVERLSAQGTGRAGGTAFERSPALRLWLGSTAAALATLKARDEPSP